MQNLISTKATVFDALKYLDTNSTNILTLFVIDSNSIMQGTLTDGDIRRYLINGGSLNDNIQGAMHRDFLYVYDFDDKFIDKLHLFRKKGIKIIPCLDINKKVVGIYNLYKYKSQLPIDAVLMAGGKGERLRPLTEKMPKPLVKVGDKAIIDYNIERLISYGVKHLNVTVNYLKEQLEEHFSEPLQGIKINCVREPKYLGTIGSIQFVENFYNDTILVMNSDLFTNIDYEDFYLHFKEHDADMSVAAVPYTVSVPYGIFELDNRNIIGIKEKPTYNYYANAGIYLIKKTALNYIPKDSFFNATDLIEKLISLKKNVIRFPITGYWIDIGQHADLNKACEIVKHLK